MIIGSGATARAAAAACDELDTDIVVVHRSSMREEAMRNAVRNCRVSFLNWNVELPEADLLINTTPAHVADFFVSQFTSRPRGIFFEALYHPWPTKLLAHWRSLGGRSLDGLDLLVHQAIDQISLICKVKVSRNELAPLMRAAGLAALEE